MPDTVAIRRFEITREALLNGEFEARVAEMAARGLIEIIPAERREAAKRAMLAELPAGADVWVFGYGSLIWNPAFHFVERRVAGLYGWHRRFCFWSASGRGSPDCRGLILALDRGGSCQGVLFRIARAAADLELECVFRREMLSEIYAPRWVTAATDSGKVRAITFVANRASPRYQPEIPQDVMVRQIAAAEGQLGTCREYLFNTTRHLEALGLADRGLARLARLVANEVPP